MIPRVSVITPSYNQGDYLEFTIQSVLAQDYPEVEYIVVDGGSTDNSQAVIQRYADRLAWWVSEPDSGQAEAINKGVDHATGEIIAWLNSDDLYLPGAISRAVVALETWPEAGFVFGDAVSINAQGRPLNPLIFGNWQIEDLVRFRILCQPTVFMRRSVFEQAGALDPSYHLLLDHHLWVRMAVLAPIRYINGGDKGAFLPMAATRHHPAAKNVALASRFADETWRLLDWMRTQPVLAEYVARMQSQVLGGASRLVARYLLESGRYGESLGAYRLALRHWPFYALRHGHRIGYAILCRLGLQKAIDQLRFPFEERRRNKLVERLSGTLFPVGSTSGANQEWISLEKWPGLCLK